MSELYQGYQVAQCSFNCECYLQEVVVRLDNRAAGTLIEGAVLVVKGSYSGVSQTTPHGANERRTHLHRQCPWWHGRAIC